MYCIIYRFKVKEGKEDGFTTSWSEVTEAFKNNCGSLGSRLHIKDKCDYLAYAQWPSKKIRDIAELPIEVKNTSYAKMKASCESIEILFELSTVSDLLVNDNPNAA